MLLTVRLTVSGVKNLRNHKKMPDIMLSYDEGKFTVLGEKIACNDIKDLKGKFEFGHTGTVMITAENKTYNLYGVKEYDKVIISMENIITESRLQP